MLNHQDWDEKKIKKRSDTDCLQTSLCFQKAKVRYSQAFGSAISVEFLAGRAFGSDYSFCSSCSNTKKKQQVACTYLQTKQTIKRKTQRDLQSQNHKIEIIKPGRNG